MEIKEIFLIDRQEFEAALLDEKKKKELTERLVRQAAEAAGYREAKLKEEVSLKNDKADPMGIKKSGGSGIFGD